MEEADKNAAFFHFEIMLMQVATSKFCPYQISDLEVMPFRRIIDIRDKVHYLEAMEEATKADQQAEQERNK